MSAAVELLQAKFPNEVVEVVEFRGETTIVVKPERLVDICRALRDDAGYFFPLSLHDRRIGFFAPKPPVRPWSITFIPTGTIIASP